MRRRSFLLGALGAAWAADGSGGVLVYVQPDGLWIRELPGGTARKLVEGSVESPRFSPSGKWVSYFGSDELQVVPGAGGSGRQLGKAERGGRQPGCQWCKGDRLLVQYEDGLTLFEASDGWARPARKVSAAGLPVVFSPDGNEIVYGDSTVSGRGPGGEPLRTGRLCRLSLQSADSKSQVLVSTRLSGKIPCAWSGDGESVIYWEDPDFSESFAADGLGLFRIPANGGAPVPLGVTTLVYEDMVSLRAADSRLAVTAGNGREEWEGKRIAVIDLRTGSVTHLTDSGMAAVCPAWSPDGAVIAYSAAPAPGHSVGGGDEARRILAARRIWVTDARGNGAAHRLTNDPSYRDEEPMWSADGKSILFCRMDQENRKTLWLMRSDGTEAAQVAGPLGGEDSWFGYYGYIAWRSWFDWLGGA